MKFAHLCMIIGATNTEKVLIKVYVSFLYEMSNRCIVIGPKPDIHYLMTDARSQGVQGSCKKRRAAAA